MFPTAYFFMKNAFKQEMKIPVKTFLPNKTKRALRETKATSACLKQKNLDDAEEKTEITHWQIWCS